MSRFRIVSEVDPARTATDDAAEQLLRQVVGALVPQLQQQVGAVRHRAGDRLGTDWTTEGWLDDGTYVSLGVEVGSGAVVLILDTEPALKAYRPAPLGYKVALVVTAAVAALGGWWRFRTIGSLVGGMAVGAAAWTIVEIFLNVRAARRAISRRVVDENDWRRRLLASTAPASA